MHHVPSKYQNDLYNWVETGTGSAIVKAVAGSGKTSSLIESIKRMAGRIIVLAFNTKIKYDIGNKVEKLFMPNVTVSTFHAICLQALKKSRARIFVDGDKVRKIIDELIHNDKEDQIKFIAGFINRLVTLAKDSAFGVSGQTSITDFDAWDALATHHDLDLEDCDIDRKGAIELCMEVLKLSNQDRQTVDFSDMIYHVLLFNIDTPKFDWVLVDEAQDTNTSRLLVCVKLKADNGRLIAVGDDAQAIYGFTGSDSDSLNTIQKTFDAIVLPLSICYRCAKSIVTKAQEILPEIEAFESNGEGTVTNMDYEKFLDAVPEYNLNYKDGIICRNNAPLIPLAFGLIRKGVSCRIEGKDIGNQLAQYTRKWKDRGLQDFMEKFTNFIDKDIDKATEKKNQQKVGALVDKKNCMLALIDRCFSLGQTTVQCLQKLILDMFSDSESGKIRTDILVLSSVHKSKGLEWDRVFILGYSQFMPSKYAVLPWQQVQENNLRYVSVTRAKNELIFVDNVPTGNKKDEQKP